MRRHTTERNAAAVGGVVKRIFRRLRRSPLVIGAAAVALFLLVVIVTNLDLLQARRGTVRTDFGTFYAAFHVGDDEAHNLHDVQTLRRAGRAGGLKGRPYPYLYPPTLAVAGRPLAQLRPGTAQRVWDWCSVVAAALVAAMALLAARRRTSDNMTLFVGTALLLLLLPIRNNLAMGQVNLLVLVPVTGAMVAYGRRRDTLAGAALAVAALIKLVPAFLILFWLARRRYRALLGFVVVALAGVVLIGLLGGWTRWSQFATFVIDTAGRDDIPGLFALDAPWSFSLKSVSLRLFGRGMAASLVPYGIAASMSAWLFWRTRRATSDEAAMPLLLGFLGVMVITSPLTYLHHVIFLLPGAVLLLGRTHKRAARHGLWLMALALIAGTDLPLFYPKLKLPAALAPLLTAVNLWALLALAVLGVRSARAR